MNNKYPYSYIVSLQYLGFRYHGWQKQPGYKTVQEMIDKTMRFIYGVDIQFKSLGAGRTDAMVSCLDFLCEFFIDQKLETDFIKRFNSELPQDIKVNWIKPKTEEFNIIQDIKSKEYHYNFCFGSKMHPFNASFIKYIPGKLNISLMQEAAQVFEGTNNFKCFRHRPETDSEPSRTILSSKIERNSELRSSFLDQEVFTYKVQGKGFMRYQVRYMMGALIAVGQEKISIQDIEETLVAPKQKLTKKASASGLVLFKTNL